MRGCGLVTLCVSHRVCSLKAWEGKCSSWEDTHWWAYAAFCSRWRSVFRYFIWRDPHFFIHFHIIPSLCWHVFLSLRMPAQLFHTWAWPVFLLLFWVLASDQVITDSIKNILSVWKLFLSSCCYMTLIAFVVPLRRWCDQHLDRRAIHTNHTPCCIHDHRLCELVKLLLHRPPLPFYCGRCPKLLTVHKSLSTCCM